MKDRFVLIILNKLTYICMHVCVWIGPLQDHIQLIQPNYGAPNVDNFLLLVPAASNENTSNQMEYGSGSQDYDSHGAVASKDANTFPNHALHNVTMDLEVK
ncbi:hypothetical protein ACET3Z_026698 [Daucus carota]